MAQTHARFEMESAFVGSAVKLALVHARDQLTRDVPFSRKIEDADDATHGRALW